MKPAWPAILRTTLIGTGQGLFLVVFLVDVLKGDSAKRLVAVSCAVSLALLAGGLIAAFFPPGRPGNSGRAASLPPAFMAAAAVYGISALFSFGRTFSILIGAAAAVLCVALFAWTAMTDASRNGASRKFLPEWRSPLTLANYFLLGTASGATLAVPLAVLFYPQFAGPLALAAFALAALAWLARIAALVRDARRQQKAASAGALGVAHPLLLRAVRWSFLALLFPLPGWLLGWGGGSLAAFAAAFALQFAGLLAERWDFFAEARQPQDPNDQAMA